MASSFAANSTIPLPLAGFSEGLVNPAWGPLVVGLGYYLVMDLCHSPP
jgi:hypothetical protein